MNSFTPAQIGRLRNETYRVNEIGRMMGTRVEWKSQKFGPGSQKSRVLAGHSTFVGPLEDWSRGPADFSVNYVENWNFYLRWQPWELLHLNLFTWSYAAYHTVLIVQIEKSQSVYAWIGSSKQCSKGAFTIVPRSLLKFCENDGECLFHFSHFLTIFAIAKIIFASLSKHVIHVLHSMLSSVLHEHYLRGANPIFFCTR